MAPIMLPPLVMVLVMANGQDAGYGAAAYSYGYTTEDAIEVCLGSLPTRPRAQTNSHCMVFEKLVGRI